MFEDENVKKAVGRKEGNRRLVKAGGVRGCGI